MLEEVRRALRLSTTAYDDELIQLEEEAMLDLESEGIRANALFFDPLIKRAVISYCRVNFGSPSDYDRMKAAYDGQKAKLKISRRYCVRREEERHDPCGCGDAD